MDFATIVKAPTLDKDWLKKCAIIGLLCLVPFAGLFNLLGWMKATYARAKAGDPTLPEASFDYLGAGWATFVAMLPLGLMQVGMMGAVIVLQVLKLHMVATLLNLVFQLVSLALTLVVAPTLMYRHLVHGKGFSDGFDFAGIQKVITTNTSLFFTYALTSFVGGLIGGLGFLLCCVGIFLTLPYGVAVQANAIRSFEQTNGGL